MLDPALDDALEPLLVVLVDQLEVLLGVFFAKDFLHLGQDEALLANHFRRLLHWDFEHGISNLDLLFLLGFFLDWLFFFGLLLG